MPRILYVIPYGGDPEDYAKAATASGAGEIVVGVPPGLSEQLEGVRLPMVYTEPDPAPEPETPAEPEQPALDPALVEAWQDATTIAQLRAAGVKLFAALGVTT